MTHPIRLLMLALLAGCGGPDPVKKTPEQPGTTGDTDVLTDTDTDPTVPDVELPTYEVLGPRERLVRASLDLRGVRPTPEEVAAVVGDPAVVDGMIRSFIRDDPRFIERMVALAADIFLTRDEDPFVKLWTWEDQYSSEDLYRAVGEEPARIWGQVIAEDLPATELVTGDWTMVDDVLASIYPVEQVPGTSGWHKARYTDGRGAAGILATNGLWWQHGSMENNLNRGRANATSRIFLCYDYLDLEVDFGTDQPLGSEDALGNAVRTDPNCTVCHQTLDPLASHFFGFWWFGNQKPHGTEISHYHPDREQEWMSYDMPPPAVNGIATNGLGDLGTTLASQPQFSQCMVEHSWSMLLGRPPESHEQVLLALHHQTFEDAGLAFRPLLEEIALSDAFAEGAGEHGRKIADPALLVSSVEALTGYRLSLDQWDALRAPVNGFGPLTGVVDGLVRYERLGDPIVTYTFALKRFAEAAAMYGVVEDLTNRDAPRLLTLVDGTEHPVQQRDRITDQVVELHLRIHSEVVQPTDPEVTAEVDLFTDVLGATSSPRQAWASVISLLLRDPRFFSY